MFHFTSYFLTGHGGEKENGEYILLRSRAQIPLQTEIIDSFNARTCKDLIGLPQVFVVLSCRGEQINQVDMRNLGAGGSSINDFIPLAGPSTMVPNILHRCVSVVNACRLVFLLCCIILNFDFKRDSVSILALNSRFQQTLTIDSEQTGKIECLFSREGLYPLIFFQICFAVNRRAHVHPLLRIQGFSPRAELLRSGQSRPRN